MKQRNVWRSLIIIVLAAVMAMPASAGRRGETVHREQLAEENARLMVSISDRFEEPAEWDDRDNGSGKMPVRTPCGGDVSLFEGEETSGEPYNIWVDGVQFTSDKPARGTSWEYDPEKQWLTLYNYDGAEIFAKGSLSIWSYGDSVIHAGAGYDGIYCEGNLNLYCMTGTLTVIGAEADEKCGQYGYAAVFATNTLICTALEDTAMTLTGGTSNISGVDGGDGIYAGYVALTRTGKFYITGGAATAPAEYGGYAIYAIDVLVYADCELRGGAGPNPSEAVCMWRDFVISHVNAVVAASAAGFRAATEDQSNGRNLYIDYAEYWFAEDRSEIRTVPKEYTLVVDFGSGTVDGQTSMTIKDPFDFLKKPAKRDLSVVAPVRYGYIQTGWLSYYGDNDPQPVELNAEYTVPFTPGGTETEAWLIAVWQCVGPEYVVDEDSVAVALPDDWCAEQQLTRAVLAVYDQHGKLLGADETVWEDGWDLWLEVTPDMAKADSCKVFLLNDSYVPVQAELSKNLT